MPKILNRNQLKYIAIVAMLIDHIAFMFITNPYLYYPMRIIGRLTAPIMCYFLVEGYMHTSSKKKYGIRLFLFALISQIPYCFAFEYEYFKNYNMMFTLFIGFIMLLCCENIKQPILKWIVIIALIFVSIPSDWALIAPGWILVLYIFKDKGISNQISAFTSLTITYTAFLINTDLDSGLLWYDSALTLATLLFIPLLLLYNGEGGKSSKFNKWFFYIFYPAHLIILGIIANIIK